MAKKEKFVQSTSSSKRVAPVSMKKEEHQFVIDGFLLDEVLKQVPPTLTINQAYVCLVKRASDVRIAVPNALKKIGITTMRDSGSKRTVSMIFDVIKKETIRQKVHEACKRLDMPYEKAYFRYVVLANKEGLVKFMHCTKEMKPNELDLRKKLRVLGATLGVGKVQSVISDLGASKYRCVIKEEPARFIMCSKE